MEVKITDLEAILDISDEQGIIQSLIDVIYDWDDEIDSIEEFIIAVITCLNGDVKITSVKFGLYIENSIQDLWKQESLYSLKILLEESKYVYLSDLLFSLLFQCKSFYYNYYKNNNDLLSNGS